MFKISKNYILCCLIIEIIFGCCTGFRIYEFHDVCENTLEDEAGELRFDAQKLPSYSFDSKCSVTVQPRSNSLPEPIQVTFYFTKFDLNGPCEDMSLTVKEGGPIFKKPVEGLPEHICGHNQSLEKASQIFKTTSDKFTVAFERKDIARYSKGNFTIKFIAFYSGECEGSNVYNCSNGHCISSTYECSTDINSCVDNGDHMEHCNFLKTLSEEGPTIFDIIRDYSGLFIVIICLCLLKCFWKTCKEKFKCNVSFRETIANCVHAIEHCFTESLQNCRDVGHRSSNTSVCRNSFQPQDVQESPRLHARENAQETGYDELSQESISLRETGNDELSPEFIRIDSLSEDPTPDEQNTQRSPNSPSAPPPTYDEVMASSYPDPSAPSYEEVIANRHKYESDI